MAERPAKTSSHDRLQNRGGDDAVPSPGVSAPSTGSGTIPGGGASPGSSRPLAPAFLVPLEARRVEITVINSRFIASLAPTPTREAARAWVQSIRAEFPDATHNVPAFIIGGGNTRDEYCSDDGEPSGTAGRPLLQVLRGCGLGNFAVVVTRYFGGILLGTGGLVKAYTEAAQAVLEGCPRGRLEPVHRTMLAAPYSFLERLRLLIPAFHGQVEEESFGDDITLVFLLPVAAWPGFCTALAELSAGGLVPEIMETFVQAVPVDPDRTNR